MTVFIHLYIHTQKTDHSRRLKKFYSGIMNANLLQSCFTCGCWPEKDAASGADFKPQGWCCSEDGDYEKEGCVAGDSCLCVGLVCFVSWRSSREKVVCVSKLKFTHNTIPNLLYKTAAGSWSLRLQWGGAKPFLGSAGLQVGGSSLLFLGPGVPSGAPGPAACTMEKERKYCCSP